MLSVIDIWFWAISISVLFTLQPFFKTPGSLVRGIQWVAAGGAVVAFGASISFINTLPGAMLATICAWHLLSILRFFKRRHSHSELIRRISTTTLWLLPLIPFGAYFATYEEQLISVDSLEYTRVFIASLALAIAALLLLTTVWNILTRRIKKSPVISDQQKPTVTLAIPARNETHALNAVIKSAVQSDYPKLEILVLDDCSQDRTPEIIKEFAHDGVRFVQGIEPSSSWLGKNRAYRILAEEASGEIILFSGVDVHYGPSSISRLIEYLQNSKLAMVSVMPRRRGLNVWANFLQPLRYLSQIALPLDILGRQPVLSSCWAISRTELRKLKGFNPVKGEIVPEQHFARIFARRHQYSFIVAGQWLGITTRKRLSYQIETATRTLYPRIWQEMAFLVAAVLVSLVLFVLPYVTIIDWMISGDQMDSAVRISIISIALLSLTNISISVRNHPRSAVLSLLSLPFIVIAYAISAIWSVLKYEFGTVNWKGRNVCLPVLEQKRVH